MQVGQAPVLLKKEIDGFALNRVQAAIIAESWRLVQVSVFWASGWGVVLKSQFFKALPTSSNVSHEYAFITFVFKCKKMVNI